MESLWYLEYDAISFETDFMKINFEALLEQAVSDPDALNLSQLYNFNNNKFENTLQKYLAEFLEVFKNFFQDLLEISENENITNFSKSALLYIQVERLYFLSYWRIFGHENFMMNRLLSSYLRIKNLLMNFHFNCFPKLYGSKELNSGPKYRRRFSLTKTDQTSYDLLFKRSEELKFFQNYLCNTFEVIIKESKKQKPIVENITIFFKKTLHYSKNIINKNSYYLKQENENLFGDTVEKILIDKILVENKMKMNLVQKEIENERNFEVKKNKNINSVRFDAQVQILSKPKEENKRKNSHFIKEIIKETEYIQRKVSIKLTENESEKKNSTKIQKKTKDIEKSTQNGNKLFFLKSKGLIPPLPSQKVKDKLVEDPLIRESIMKSLTNYFKREEKYQQIPEKNEYKTTETLNKIKSNITNVIDEQKINKFKNLNEKINSNLEILINELSNRKKKIEDAYQTIILENNDLMIRDSKKLYSFIPEKHHSIEMVSGDKFAESYDSPPKYNDFQCYSNEGNNNEIENSEVKSQKKSKISVLNVIKKNEEREIKDHKISEMCSITSNGRNTHVSTTLISPLLKISREPSSNSLPFSIWNLIKKNIKAISSSQRMTLKINPIIIANKISKLNISEKDIIKIDSNTEINEELKFVKTSERMALDMIRDEDLFSKIYSIYFKKNISFACKYSFEFFRILLISSKKLFDFV